MNVDMSTPAQDTPYIPAGPGSLITQRCDFCVPPANKQTLGSKRVGPFKLFCCAQCVARRAAEKAAGQAAKVAP